jgi:hypothetical protein
MDMELSIGSINSRQIKYYTLKPGQMTSVVKGQPHAHLGAAYNSIKGAFVGDTAFDPRNGFKSDDNLSIDCTITRIENQYHFLHQFEASASAAFGGTSWGVNASIQFAESIQIDQEDLNVLAHLKVTKSTQSFEPLFSLNALRILGQNNKQLFLKTFGDEYCKFVIFGGELIMVFAFNTRSVVKQSSIDASLGGHYFGSQTTGNLVDFIREATNHNELRIQAFIGGNTDPVETNPAKILDWIKAFPKAVQDEAYVMKDVFVGYDGVSSRPLHVDIPNFLYCSRAMGGLEEMANTTDSYIKRLQRVRDYPFEFMPDTSDQPIERRIDALMEIKTKIEHTASAIIEDPARANLRLPSVNLAKTAGQFPEGRDSRIVPVKVDVTDSEGITKSGDGSDWVGSEKKSVFIKVVRVFFTSPVFNQPNPPLVIKVSYLCSQHQWTGEYRAYATQPLPGDQSQPPQDVVELNLSSPIALIMFLEGDDSILYNVHYEVKRVNGVMPLDQKMGSQQGMRQERY